ncbi:MAG TPA: AAA family ATPase [Candidatus Elarobacter sp.]|jgi:ATP/maltotriose-dependent transcriptional regulator MalT
MLLHTDVPAGALQTTATQPRFPRGPGSLVLPSPAVARLAEAARKPIALVVAPAGFGKSTLLREFVAQRPAALLIDLAAGEGTFRDAVRLICEALHAVAPGARLAFPSAYARAAERGQRTVSLARWLARYLDETDVTIVVDSAGRLNGETALFAEFAETLARCAATAHLVVAAPDDTDLPIPRWFADDLMSMPVGADDLRWGLEQAADAARRLGVRRDDAALARIVETAHGRPFEIVYSLRTGETPPRGEPPGETLFRGLGAHERAYVLETCLFRVLDDAVLASAGLAAHPLLAAQSRLGDLIGRSDESSYRYDEALRAQAERMLRSDPEAFERVALRTVDALELVGRVREALDRAREARLENRVRRLLHVHGLRLEDRGDVDAVEAALDVVVDDSLDAVLYLLRGTRESRLGRTDTCEAWFRHAIAHAGTRDVTAEATYRLARELVRRGRGDAVELLEPFAAEEGLAIEQRCAILSVLAEAYLVVRRPGDARATLRRALLHADDLDVAARAHLFTRASYVELYAGERERAREYATIGAALAEEAHLYTMAVGSYSVLYNVAYEDAGPSESLVYLRRLGDSAIRSGNVDFLLYTIVAAYELRVEQGDVAAVERLERDLREFDLHYGASAALEGLLPSRALVAAWKGDFATAYEILAPSGPQQSSTEREALRWAEIALYAAAAGMREAAQSALARFHEAFARDETAHSQHGARAAIVARLATASCGGDWRAPESPPSARLRALEHAVDVVVRHRRDDRDAGAETLLEAFGALRRHEMGGMAKLLAALPMGDA